VVALESEGSGGVEMVAVEMYCRQQRHSSSTGHEDPAVMEQSSLLSVLSNNPRTVATSTPMFVVLAWLHMLQRCCTGCPLLSPESPIAALSTLPCAVQLPPRWFPYCSFQQAQHQLLLIA
jgi:hypothetical protein